MQLPNIIFIFLLAAAMLATYKSKKLTAPGILTGGIVAIAIYLGVGFIGIAMLGAFFVLSVLATSFGKSAKRKLNPEYNDPEQRDAGQVLANGGMAALLGTAAYYLQDQATVLVILTAAAFASATADTLSSELGTVFGRRFYNIVTLKPDQKGRDGVISLEGTLIGVAGSAVISLIYSLGFGWNINSLFIIIAGTIGNLTDSVLGATLERKNRLNNNAVNFLNTAVAVISCWIMIKVFHS
ncbi:TIGR00297 family protein [Mucilaginibacter sp.]|uniref:DUF92 domain-containing protein n=1 Tax=Mucilaginibacter sp. TaxID=1882438 RepID=UPI0035BBBA17